MVQLCDMIKNTILKERSYKDEYTGTKRGNP